MQRPAAERTKLGSGRRLIVAEEILAHLAWMLFRQRIEITILEWSTDVLGDARMTTRTACGEDSLAPGNGSLAELFI